MNTEQERRVVEALQALTGGLTVTEQDIITANGRLKDNLEPPSPRRKLVAAAIVAAAAVVATMVVVQLVNDDKSSSSNTITNETETPADVLTNALVDRPYFLSDEEFLGGAPVRRENLTGLWLSRPIVGVDEGNIFSPAFMVIDADGDWRIGHPIEPLGFGESSVSGDTWTRHFDPTSNCAQHHGPGGAFDQPTSAALAEDGSLRIEIHPGSWCSTLDSREVWTRLTPGAPVMTYFLSVSEDLSWEAPSQPTGPRDEDVTDQLAGVYVSVSTGQMLVVGDDGDYLFFDDVESASLRPAERGFLSHTDGAVSGSCEGGATFEGTAEIAQTPAVSGYVHSRQLLRLTTNGSGCGSALGDQGPWVQVTHGRTRNPFRE